MRKTKQQSEVSWVLPKRAPTPLNFDGCKVKWMKTNCKTSKKVSAVVPRKVTPAPKDVRQDEGNRKKIDALASQSTFDDTGKCPEPEAYLEANPKPLAVTPDAGKVQLPVDERLVTEDQTVPTETRRENEPQIRERPERQRPIEPPVKKEASSSPDVLATPNDQEHETMKGVPTDVLQSQVLSSQTRDGSIHNLLAASKTIFVDEWQVNAVEYLGICVGTSDACEHCKLAFSFLETKVNEYTFRRTCKVKSNFHYSCKLERGVLKRQQLTVLRQIRKLGYLREQQQQRLLESEAFARRERSWKADIEPCRSRSPSKHQEQETNYKKARSFGLGRQRKGTNNTHERPRSPTRRRPTSKTNDAAKPATSNSSHGTMRTKNSFKFHATYESSHPKMDISTRDRVSPTRLVQRQNDAELLPKKTRTGQNYDREMVMQNKQSHA